MIYYKPVTDIGELKKLFPNEKMQDGGIYGGYIGFDECGNNVGKCFMSVFGSKCSVSALECNLNDKLLVEGFVRAALNFCANRNAYMAYSTDERIKDVLLLLGFENNNGVYSGDIPTLLKGSCCKH